MQVNTNYNLLLSIFIFAWCNDTFAYLVGCKFGKKRLFERHSPKKSWEGFFGGLSATIIAAVVMYLIYGNGLVAWLLIAILTSVVGTLGDLVESMFKRQMGVKDSGNILPGHGGILDRFDILLLVLPAVWICLSLLGQFFPVF
jgi:phosphatidate cytidylyltransferase